MREINGSQRIFRLQAHLLKRRRTQKWRSKRVYYNKREKILLKDIKIFTTSRYIKTFVKRLRQFQRNMSEGIRDPIYQRRKRMFEKLTDIDLIIKIRRIVSGLKGKYLQKDGNKKISLPSSNILSWLRSYFQNQKEIQFLNQTPKCEKNIIYHAICKLSKENEVQADKKYESAESWYKSFILQCRPFTPEQINGANVNIFDCLSMQDREEFKNIIQLDQIELFNNKNSQVPQVNERLKQFPRGNALKALIEKVENEFQEIKLHKIHPKPQTSSQFKVLKIKKPICPFPGCKGQLTVRKCPNFNHLVTICQKCSWNQHTCSDISVENNFLQQIDIVAKGEIIKNFKIKSLKKADSPNNLLQVLAKLNYKYTNKMKILPGTPQKVICYYPVLGESSCRQILKNRQQECFLPLKIKQSSIKGAGLGVFATVEIKQVGTLVCSYLAEIGIGSKTPILRSSEYQQIINDSIFTLGWIEKQLFLAAPNQYTNIGRFINYNEAKKCNLKASICLLETGEKKYEISVFLTTIRQVRKGQELFYNYGTEYSFQKQ